MLGGESHSQRSGLLLFDRECGSWAEAAPLPGFSEEDLDQVVGAAVDGQWNRWPSLEFAYSALARGWPKRALPINAMLMGSSSEILNRAEELSKNATSAVKLKVGRLADLESEIEQVRGVRSRLRPNQALRLDANRQWTRAIATEFLREIRDASIEFIEEPCNDPADFETVAQATGVGYALDETTREQGFTPQAFPNASAVVIKPTMTRQATIETLAAGKIPCVFSASFESGIGLLNIAALAIELTQTQPAGLDTYQWLAADLCAPRLLFENGQLAPPDSNHLKIDRTRLVEVQV